ncbi:hypothetical protein [Microvirga arsenatis]|uniref:Transposase n=1 Tax=Microvirga arsenatis TaxID=2692265 RepID=A0ABW9YYF1_9HYPH|nr:hypothetical protein [Microvirga arsenatis]NBJ10355.1 hypothetical protein [Microvirga arsenatis]NBJ24746.1 hypothetical protein [Microvirga arsenatis]
MMRFFEIFSKAVEPEAALPATPLRNWRCQLGTFWQDIEEAGSVLKARRQRSRMTAPPVRGATHHSDQAADLDTRR